MLGATGSQTGTTIARKHRITRLLLLLKTIRLRLSEERYGIPLGITEPVFKGKGEGTVDQGKDEGEERDGVGDDEELEEGDDGLGLDEHEPELDEQEEH